MRKKQKLIDFFMIAGVAAIGTLYAVGLVLACIYFSKVSHAVMTFFIENTTVCMAFIALQLPVFGWCLWLTIMRRRDNGKRG